MDKKPDAVLIHDQLAGLFAERYFRYKSDPYWDAFTYSRRKIKQVLEGYLGNAPASSHVLDIGCGTGHFLKELSDRGFHCAGCDPSDEMLGYARRLNSSMSFENASMERLPYQSDSFDIVIAIEVMRYIQNMDLALSEVHRVLKPGGQCLLTHAPKFSTSLYPLLNKLTSVVQIAKFSKVRQYFNSVRELRRLYEKAGFTDVQVVARFLGPFIYVDRLYRPLASRMLRAWEPIDDKISDRPMLKNLSNLFVVAARKSRS
jgi:ubiquinone/menaquinone biosynthesis C-methylase UbiE